MVYTSPAISLDSTVDKYHDYSVEHEALSVDYEKSVNKYISKRGYALRELKSAFFDDCVPATHLDFRSSYPSSQIDTHLHLEIVDQCTFAPILYITINANQHGFVLSVSDHHSPVPHQCFLTVCLRLIFLTFARP